MNAMTSFNTSQPSGEESPLLNEEMDGHRTRVADWVAKVNEAPVSASGTSVRNRFLRDCYTFVQDLDSATDPSMSDLNDFDSQVNTLEIRYHQIADNFQ